jgi:hypothetical protein
MKLRFLLIAAVLSSAALAASQTSSESASEKFPLSLWAEHKQVTQIPWRVSVGKTSYRSDLRQELQVRTSISPIDLNKSGDTHDLVLFARVLDGTTPVTSIHSVAPIDSSLSLYPQSFGRGAGWTLVAIVRPGKYKLELAVLDRATGRYSTRYEDLTVPGNESDPLEQSLRSFPRFEFVEAVKPEDRDRSLRNQVSIFRGGSISDRMNPLRAPYLTVRDFGVSPDPPPSFVVDKAGKLHLSVITILSPPEQSLDNEYRLSLFQNNLTNLIFPFSQINVVHGTATLIGVDLTNRSFVFDRRDLKEVTREILDDAVTDIRKNSNTVSIDALAGKSDRGHFFRDVLRARIEAGEKESDGAEHVIIVVAVRSKFPKGSSIPPLIPERDCHCRVIYVRFALEPNDFDDVDSLLKAYKPRVFEPLDWQEYRKHFATIYEQLVR